MALALVAGVRAETRFFGNLKAGVEDVTLDRSRLRFDRDGVLRELPVQEGTLQNRFQGGFTVLDERGFGGQWILDTEIRADFDTFSELQVTAERYDRVATLARTTLARALPNDAYLSVEARAETYLEQFLPDLEGTIAGLDVTYEKEVKGDGYLQARVGYRSGELENNQADSFDEMRFQLEYEHLPPERLRPDVLPFHADEAPPSDWEFLYAHALRLDKARDLIRLQGNASMLADLAPDPPLPQAWKGGGVRPRIGIRESVFTAGLQALERELDGGNSFFRGSLWAGIEWSLTDFLALAVRDSIAAQNWQFADRARVRSDRIQNHFSVDLSYVKEFTYLSAQVGLDSHFLQDFDGFDYNRGFYGLYGAYDPGGKWRAAGYLRGAAERNRDEAPDFPDLTRFDTFASLFWRFDRRSRLEASLLRERVNITGLQSEFDSAYLDQTTRVAYRRHLGGKFYAEGGWQLKDETHEFFEQNDRQDQSLFMNLETRF